MLEDALDPTPSARWWPRSIRSSGSCEEDAPRARRAVRRSSPGPTRSPSPPTWSTRSPRCASSRGSPLFADLCADLIGPDVRLYWDQAVYKKPEKPTPRSRGTRTTATRSSSRSSTSRAGSPLTDATEDNGCPWVVPGLHRLGTLASTVDPLGFECLDDPRRRGAGAGRRRRHRGVLVAHAALHRPEPTDEVRKAYIVQYAPDGAEVLHDGGRATPERISADAPDRQFRDPPRRQAGRLIKERSRDLMSSGISEVPMTSGISEVIVTADGAEWLAAFIRTLVEERLCACAQHFAPIRSIYRWQGDIEDNTEVRVALHTRTELVAELIERIEHRPPLRGPLHPGHLHRQCQPCLRRVGPDRNRAGDRDPRWSNFGPKPSRLDNRIRTRGDRRHGRRAVSPPRTGIRTSPSSLHRADLRCQGDQ